MARNGCRKIIAVNGHGGNNSLRPHVAQTQPETPRDHVVYGLGIPGAGEEGPPRRSAPATDMHAGEQETSMSLAARGTADRPG